MEIKKNIIITGGAGYIGSHAVLLLMEQGWNPVIVDNFSRGNRDIAGVLNVDTCEGNIGDASFLDSVFSRYKPEAVMHFAANSYVGESVTRPELYYGNNVGATVTLLTSMVKNDVKRLIFSSTCATYGSPREMPITESTAQSPVTPYGWSKLMIEQIIRDYRHAYGLDYVVFRYFNAAGADPESRIGEKHDPETHLIPLAIYSALGLKELAIFGDDYDTPDGTCIRDYIHVLDIAEAHRLGLEYLCSGGKSDFFNIGNGNGYSVQEVIKSVENVSGCKVNSRLTERREGDPPVLVAEAAKIKSALNWTPRYAELESMVRTAWNWHSKG